MKKKENLKELMKVIVSIDFTQETFDWLNEQRNLDALSIEYPDDLYRKLQNELASMLIDEVDEAFRKFIVDIGYDEDISYELKLDDVHVGSLTAFVTICTLANIILSIPELPGKIKRFKHFITETVGKGANEKLNKLLRGSAEKNNLPAPPEQTAELTDCNIIIIEPDPIDGKEEANKPPAETPVPPAESDQVRDPYSRFPRTTKVKVSLSGIRMSDPNDVIPIAARFTNEYFVFENISNKPISDITIGLFKRNPFIDKKHRYTPADTYHVRIKELLPQQSVSFTLSDFVYPKSGSFGIRLSCHIDCVIENDGKQTIYTLFMRRR